MKKTQGKKKQSESRKVDVVPRRDAPTADREIETLLEQARRHLAEARRLNGEAVALGRRSVWEFYQAGRVLAIIREKLKPTQHSWVAWQKENKLSRNRANLAIRLFEAVRDPAELEEFKTIRRALRHYGIEKTPEETAPPGPAPTKSPAGPPQNRADEGDVRGGHEDDEDQAGAGKDDDQPDTPPQEPQVPCVQGKLQVERRGKKTTFKVEDVEVRMDRVPPCKFVVRIVPRWCSELRQVLENKEAVLILPGVEVPDAAAG